MLLLCDALNSFAQHAGELTTWGAGNLPPVLLGDCARSYRAVRFFRASCEEPKNPALRTTLVTLSVLVRSVLSINHRLTSEDASYERAGPRHGAGLLFFGVRGGAEPRRADAETEQQGSGAMATQSLYQVMQVCSSKSFDNPVCFA